MMRVRFPSPAPATAGPPATACRQPEGAAVRSRILGTVLIAQISDCHIRDGDGTFGGLIDTSATLARVVSELCSLDPSPDVVLATGDLTEDGTGSQYARLSDLLSDLRVRILPLPGNHDEGAAFRTAFADRLPETVAEGHCSYVVDDYEVRLVGLDTSLPGRHDGHFDDERAEWLEKTLAENPDKPTLLFTHFPPFQTGLCFMDVSGLADADRLRAVIERNPQVRLMVKMRFLMGIARKTAETNGVVGFPQVRETLGQLAAQCAMVDSLVHAMEIKGEMRGDYFVPDRHTLYAAQVLTQQLYATVITTLRDLAGGGMIMLPSSVEDFANPEIATLIGKTQQSPTTTSEGRVKFFKLAWDAVGSEFASRHTQYEMFYAGATFVTKGHSFRTFDWDRCTGLVDRMLDTYSLESELAQLKTAAE